LRKSSPCFNREPGDDSGPALAGSRNRMLVYSLV
jgi:hypothetical protein